MGAAWTTVPAARFPGAGICCSDSSPPGWELSLLPSVRVSLPGASFRLLLRSCFQPAHQAGEDHLPRAAWPPVRSVCFFSKTVCCRGEVTPIPAVGVSSARSLGSATVWETLLRAGTTSPSPHHLALRGGGHSQRGTGPAQKPCPVWGQVEEWRASENPGRTARAAASSRTSLGEQKPEFKKNIFLI